MKLEEMKEAIKAYTKKQKEEFKGVEEPWNTITLYHGTTTRHLNSIFKHGLTPRKVSQINNFSDVPSNEELIYLTNKWHYWYAYHANQESLKCELGKERFESTFSFTEMWNETSDFPMYVTCEVPVELLTLDEDVVYQFNIKKGMRDGKIVSPEDITVEMCLEQGTVASLDTIAPEYINEFIILGNEEYREYLLEGQYGEDASAWFKGLGVGQSDIRDLNLLELSTFRNGNDIVDMKYPATNNIPVQKISLEGNELLIVRS